MLWIAVEHIIVRLFEFLTLEVEVGSLLRAALAPKTRASLASLGLLRSSGNWIARLFGSPCEGEPSEGSISSEA